MEAAGGSRPVGVSFGHAGPVPPSHVREISRLHASAAALQTALRAERAHSSAEHRRLQGSVDALTAERAKLLIHKDAAEHGLAAISAFTALERQQLELREASALARDALLAAVAEREGAAPKADGTGGGGGASSSSAAAAAAAAAPAGDDRGSAWQPLEEPR